MADWRKLALELALADGKIDETEVKILKKRMYADGKISNAEVEFLCELRELAQKKAKANKAELDPKFERFFFDALQANVLRDGKIDAAEVAWMKEMLYADKKIDANEKKFLTALKKKAERTSPEFDALYAKCVGTGKKAGAAKKK